MVDDILERGHIKTRRLQANCPKDSPREIVGKRNGCQDRKAVVKQWFEDDRDVHVSNSEIVRKNNWFIRSCLT